MVSDYESKSDVARILQQIQMEYEAAQRALTGMAYGIARHDFINARMERMGECQLQLNDIVGPRTAGKLIAETLREDE